MQFTIEYPAGVNRCRPQPKARLSSVANSIRLLGSFSGDENELGITALAGRLRLAKSTVHRLATTLTAARFLEQKPRPQVRLGLALFEPARWCAGAWTWRTEARPKLRELLEKTGETVQPRHRRSPERALCDEMESRRARSHGRASADARRCTARPRRQRCCSPRSRRTFVRQVIEAGLTAYTPKTSICRERIPRYRASLRRADVAPAPLDMCGVRIRTACRLGELPARASRTHPSGEMTEPVSTAPGAGPARRMAARESARARGVSRAPLAAVSAATEYASRATTVAAVRLHRGGASAAARDSPACGRARFRGRAGDARRCPRHDRLARGRA